MSIAGWLIDRYFIKKPRLRRAVTAALHGNRETTAELFGTTLAVHTVKENGYLRAARLARRSSAYRDEAAVLVNLALLLADGDVFVDVGANVGLFSATLARRSRLAGAANRFVAFEANPDTYARLVKSTAPLGVETHPFALAATDGELEFVPGAVSHVFTTVDKANSYNLAVPSQKIPCRRLDGVMLPPGPLVIKIDVEGQERAVLDGATALFDAGRVKAVYIDGYEDQSIPDLLRSRGFSLADGRTLLPADPPAFSLLAVRRS